MKFGNKFNTKVRYVVLANEGELHQDINESSGSSKLCISWDVLWLGGRPILAPAIKRAIKNQINKNFAPYNAVLLKKMQET